MASVQLTKKDKLEALNNMVLAKYRDEYKALQNRRTDLAVRVYEDTIGKLGNQLRMVAGRDWEHWLETRADVALPGIPVPHCHVDSGKRPSTYHWGYKDLFTGAENDRKIDPDVASIVLPRSVVWPSSQFNRKLELSEAKAPTKKVADTLRRDIDKFNEEAKEFYTEAYCILERIRSTRKVDEMFPELWDYFPAGLRERLKQGMIVLGQDEVDSLRKKLPKKRRDN